MLEFFIRKDVYKFTGSSVFRKEVSAFDLLRCSGLCAVVIMLSLSSGIWDAVIEWVKWVKSLSCVWLFVTLWTVACKAPPSMGFSRQEYWSGVPFPFPGDLPDPGIEPRSPALQADALPSDPPGKPQSLGLPNPLSSYSSSHPQGGLFGEDRREESKVKWRRQARAIPVSGSSRSPPHPGEFTSSCPNLPRKA